MKTEELLALGIEQDVVSKIMAMNGKELNPLKEKLTKLERQIAEKDNSITELNEKITAFSGSAEELEKLKTQVEQYKIAEAERVKAEEQTNADKAFEESMSSIIGDKKFTNDFTKNGIFQEIKAEMSKAENKSLGLKDVFERVIKDRADIWQNPQQNVVIKGAGSLDNSTIKAHMDKVYANNPFYKG